MQTGWYRKYLTEIEISDVHLSYIPIYSSVAVAAAWDIVLNVVWLAVQSGSLWGVITSSERDWSSNLMFAIHWGKVFQSFSEHVAICNAAMTILSSFFISSIRLHEQTLVKFLKLIWNIPYFECSANTINIFKKDCLHFYTWRKFSDFRAVP